MFGRARRRPLPQWTDDELRRHLRAAWGRKGESTSAPGTLRYGAVVFHQNFTLLPKREVRRAAAANREVAEFVFYGFAWAVDDHFAHSRIGQSEMLMAYYGCHTEVAARRRAKEWLKSAGHGKRRDLAFEEFPPDVQHRVLRLIKDGPERWRPVVGWESY